MDLTGIGSIADLAGKVIDRVWTDPGEAAKQKLEVYKAEQQGWLVELQGMWNNLKDQAEINKIEAASTRLFVAGWRPFVGWTCGFSLAYKYIIRDFLIVIFKVSGLDVSNIPALDDSNMLPILLGMLGLGAMRTWEKVKKVG